MLISCMGDGDLQSDYDGNTADAPHANRLVWSSVQQCTVYCCIQLVSKDWVSIICMYKRNRKTGSICKKVGSICSCPVKLKIYIQHYYYCCCCIFILHTYFVYMSCMIWYIQQYKYSKTLLLCMILGTTAAVCMYKLLYRVIHLYNIIYLSAARRWWDTATDPLTWEPPPNRTDALLPIVKLWYLVYLCKANIPSVSLDYCCKRLCCSWVDFAVDVRVRLSERIKSHSSQKRLNLSYPLPPLASQNIHRIHTHVVRARCSLLIHGALIFVYLFFILRIL